MRRRLLATETQWGDREASTSLNANRANFTNWANRSSFAQAGVSLRAEILFGTTGRDAPFAS